jgi:hypothetical protein
LDAVDVYQRRVAMEDWSFISEEGCCGRLELQPLPACCVGFEVFSIILESYALVSIVMPYAFLASHAIFH